METFLAVYNTAYHGIVSINMKRKATPMDRFFGIFNKPKTQSLILSQTCRV
ncbi:hypothetical protein DPMN_071682 [Dreissena polymorpha]|uniref:Uncharacterized protein n=1 Tax=Dreissena polymorpha TaxID=45954 RepID=A0A9D3Z351_DREPO|nr:hypothetical protein DPMN_071682 [Dreissena polymorpha]